VHFRALRRIGSCPSYTASSLLSTITATALLALRLVNKSPNELPECQKEYNQEA
jgi:hypothetical protein